MGEPAISLRSVTKDYGHGRGIFDVDLDIEAGEVVGFLGANGAGKTVTMRTLMGFIRPDGGAARIHGLDCLRERERIQASVGYLPGEAACPTGMTGTAFLRFVAKLNVSGHATRANQTPRRMQSRMDELIARFDLDPSARIGRMSKGTRQKVAIVAAFMGLPDVLLLDEPTSGLDPLMQERFVELVNEEHARGATILMSSHMFPEIERTCERVAFIRAGHVVGVESMAGMRRARSRVYELTFRDEAECRRYVEAHRDGTRQDAHNAASAGISLDGTARGNSLRVRVAGQTGMSAGLNGAMGMTGSAAVAGAAGSDIDSSVTDAFIRDLAGYALTDLTSVEQSLEDTFLHLYGRDGDSARQETVARQHVAIAAATKEAR